MTSAVHKESTRFLQQLLTAARMLADEHPETCLGGKVLTPAQKEPSAGARKKRSPFIVEKITDRTGHDTFAVRTSGVTAINAFGIMELLAQTAGTPPLKNIKRIDDLGEPIDEDNPETRKRVARMFVEFPNGLAMQWTAVSGLGITFADRKQFEAVTDRFKLAPDQSKGREL